MNPSPSEIMAADHHAKHETVDDILIRFKSNLIKMMDCKPDIKKAREEVDRLAEELRRI